MAEPAAAGRIVALGSSVCPVRESSVLFRAVRRRFGHGRFMSIPDLVAIDSSLVPAATCVVCGTDIAAGTGVTAQFRGRTLRFKCAGRMSRFALDPDHWLTTGPTSCCDGDGHGETSHPTDMPEWV